jgi:putative hemolysin
MRLPKKSIFPCFLVILVILVLTACGGSKSEATPTSFVEKEGGDPFIGIPNPASFYCQEMGYTLELREAEGGTQGICVMPDGKQCEEWEFLSGSCAVEWTFCQRQGGVIQAGDESGTCVFADGTSCPEYEYFIGECQAPQ